MMSLCWCTIYQVCGVAKRQSVVVGFGTGRQRDVLLVRQTQKSNSSPLNTHLNDDVATLFSALRSVCVLC